MPEKLHYFNISHEKLAKIKKDAAGLFLFVESKHTIFLV